MDYFILLSGVVGPIAGMLLSAIRLRGAVRIVALLCSWFIPFTGLIWLIYAIVAKPAAASDSPGLDLIGRIFVFLTIVYGLVLTWLILALNNMANRGPISDTDDLQRFSISIGIISIVPISAYFLFRPLKK